MQRLRSLALISIMIFSVALLGHAQDNPFGKKPTGTTSKPTGTTSKPTGKPTSKPTSKPTGKPTPPRPPALPREFVNQIGMTMVRITMNGQNFYMSTTEVTQDQWQAVTGANRSYFKGTSLPVEKVSMQDVAGFLAQLNELDRERGLTYRLPTVSEWEYAAGDVYGGLDALAWYNGNSNRATHPVGMKSPNAFGLYDMFGNVWEWCEGAFVRGGSFEEPPNRCGPKAGYQEAAGGRERSIGFRVVASK